MEEISMSCYCIISESYNKFQHLLSCSCTSSWLIGGWGDHSSHMANSFVFVHEWESLWRCVRLYGYYLLWTLLWPPCKCQLCHSRRGAQGQRENERSCERKEMEGDGVRRKSKRPRTWLSGSRPAGSLEESTARTNPNFISRPALSEPPTHGVAARLWVDAYSQSQRCS